MSLRSIRATRYACLFEGPADPGLLILSRIEPRGFQCIVSTDGPITVREFALQYRYCGLCFRTNAERQIYFGDARQGLLDAGRRLKSGHNKLKAIEGTNVVTSAEIVAADIHLLVDVRVCKRIDRLLGGLGGFRKSKYVI